MALSNVRFSHRYATLEASLNTNVIGPQIRIIRLQAKPVVTQEDLVGRLAAHGIYLDRTAIARMENNSRFIRDYEIVAIAKCLRVPVASLFPA